MTRARRFSASNIMYLNVRSNTSIAFFFCNDTATTEIYTLSLHDALPIALQINGFPCHSPGKHQKGRSSEINCGLNRGIEFNVVFVHGAVSVELRERIFSVRWTHFRSFWRS